MPVTLVSPDAISSREHGTPHVGLSTLGALAHFVPQAQRKHPQHGGTPSLDPSRAREHLLAGDVDRACDAFDSNTPWEPTPPAGLHPGAPRAGSAPQ